MKALEWEIKLVFGSILLVSDKIISIKSFSFIQGLFPEVTLLNLVLSKFNEPLAC